MPKAVLVAVGVGLLQWGCGGGSPGSQTSAGTGGSPTSTSTSSAATASTTTTAGSSTVGASSSSGSGATTGAVGTNGTSQTTATASTGQGIGQSTGSGSGSKASGTTDGSATSLGTGSSGTSGAAATTGGGSTTLPSGCTEADYYNTELFLCGAGVDAGCSCGTVCTADPQLAVHVGLDGGQFCESPCSSTADCFDPATSCQSGLCQSTYCGQSGLYEACDATAPGSQDGICQILEFGVNSAETDICLFGGTATVTCDPSAIRSDKGQICVPGYQCLSDQELEIGPSVDAGECLQECNSNAASGPGVCAGGLTCYPGDQLNFGYCSQ